MRRHPARHRANSLSVSYSCICAKSCKLRDVRLLMAMTSWGSECSHAVTCEHRGARTMRKRALPDMNELVFREGACAHASAAATS